MRKLHQQFVSFPIVRSIVSFMPVKGSFLGPNQSLQGNAWLPQTHVFQVMLHKSNMRYDVSMLSISLLHIPAHWILLSGGGVIGQIYQLLWRCELEEHVSLQCLLSYIFNKLSIYTGPTIQQRVKVYKGGIYNLLYPKMAIKTFYKIMNRCF